MEITKLYRVIRNNHKMKEDFKDKILSAIDKDREGYSDLPLEILVLLLCSHIDSSLRVDKSEIIAYGAGLMAKKHIPELSREIKVCEIWDTYSNESDINGIKICRPKTNIQIDKPLFVVFIDDYAARTEVISNLRTMGYTNVFYFREYLEILKAFNTYGNDNQIINDKVKNIIDEICLESEKYELINFGNNSVLYEVLPVSAKDMQTKIADKESYSDKFKQKLLNVVKFQKITSDKIDGAIFEFLNSDLSNTFSLLYNLEKFLQTILANGTKTLERPIKMANDYPYDEFATYTVICEIMMFLFENEETAFHYSKLFRKFAYKSLPLMAVEIYFAIKCKEYEYALDISRKAMNIDPNDLLVNESFYQVAVACKNNGIYVDEPIPEYDLSEYFCWSGLNFVWCGGFDNKTDKPLFSPCFRPLQCAARPDGEFWTGEEWKEFRKSVTDGTFKYCQKNQCANIVAGWLPKKSDVKEEWLKKIIDGDMDVVPPIEELHFSYDEHCNLKCPSCRLDMKTNTHTQNLKLDELYDKNLKPMMYKAKHLTLSGCGEAILSPHSKRVLQSFSREENPDLIVELRTNATVLNENSWNSLGTGKEVIRHITASIDASTKESFEKLRYPAKWDIVLKNLDFIRALRNRGEIDLFEFHVVIQKENVNQLCDIVKMAIKYDADAVTFSRMINWRGMSEEEYKELNPFWVDNPQHSVLLKEISDLKKLREDIETEKCELTKNRKKIYINIHFVPDINNRYDKIRIGKFKIR